MKKTYHVHGSENHIVKVTSPYYFPRAAVTKYRKWFGLKQQNFILS